MGHRQGRRGFPHQPALYSTTYVISTPRYSLVRSYTKYEIETAGATLQKFGTSPRYKPLGPSVRSMYLNNPIAWVCSVGRFRFKPAETKEI